MRPYRLFIAVLLTVALAYEARAEHFIQWYDSSYPKKGSVAGTLLVKGRFTLDTDWSPTSTNGRAYFWQDGLDYLSMSVPWSFDSCTGEYVLAETGITGLTSGATYNLTVEVEITDGSTTLTIRSEPRAKAPD